MNAAQTPAPNQTTDVTLEAALRVLRQKGFVRRLSDEEWKTQCQCFRYNGFPFDTFSVIAKKTPGFNSQGVFMAWNTAAPPKRQGVGDIIKAARIADKDLFTTLKRTLSDAPQVNDTLPDRKADRIAWLLRNYTIAYNELRDAVYINGEMLSDGLFAGIHFDMMNHGVSSKQAIDSVVMTLAQQNRYHPIKDYLTRVKREYDGSSQLESIGEYFDDVDGLFPLFFRKWCVGSVARIFDHAQNPMLVLMGAQDAGKGFFVDWLCPIAEFLVSSSIQPDDKDHMLRACDRWIWEVVELGATTRIADIEKLKAFLTQKIFTVRRPYGHFDIDKPSSVSFIGTINDDGTGFLNDVTGNRRYRPVTLKSIDWSYTQHINVDLLWGQVMRIYEQGETATLTADQTITLNTDVLPRYRRVNIMEDLILEYFERSLFVSSTHDILRFLYSIGFQGHRSRADSMELAGVMKLLGHEKGKVGTKNGYFVCVKEEHMSRVEGGQDENPF